MARPRIDADREAGIVADYLAGMIYKDICQKYGVCNTLIRAVARRNHLLERNRSGYHNVTSEQVSGITKCLREGMSPTSVADLHNVSLTTVYRLRKKYNIPNFREIRTANPAKGKVSLFMEWDVYWDFQEECALAGVKVSQLAQGLFKEWVRLQRKQRGE